MTTAVKRGSECERIWRARDLEAIEFLRNTNRILGEQVSGAVTMAEESTDFPGVSRPQDMGGLGFWYKWNLGWMHDTLDYMKLDPIIVSIVTI